MKKVMLDIDGVLNNYPQTLIDYINNKLNINFKTLDEIKNTLSYSDFRELKNKYKYSYNKHNADLKVGVHELIKYFRDNNYLIYIITSRDFNSQQVELTIRWLKDNKVEYDFLYFTENKGLLLLENLGYMDIIIEDSIENVHDIKEYTDFGKYYLVKDNLKEILEEIKYESN